MKEVKKAVILCGGLATRFLPISKSVPKEMFPLLDKPILQVIVEDLAKAGIKDILIIVGRGKECILNHFDKNVELEQRLLQTGKLDFLAKAQEPQKLANIFYLRQYEPKGTGACIESVKSFVGEEPFAMMFGDEVMFCEGKNVVEQLLETYQKENKSVIAVKRVPMEEIYRYGIISTGKEIDNGYEVKNIVEKPKVEDAPSDISYTGPAILKNEIFEALEKLEVEEGKEKSLTDSFKFLCEKNSLCARFVEGQRHDMGNKFGFVIANIEACLRDEEFSPKMKEYIMKRADEIKNK